MKNALKKLRLTDTDTQPEAALPSWKDNPEFVRWTTKAQEIARQLQNTKSEQRENQAKMEEGQAAVVQARSAVILEEGNETDLQKAEASLAAILEKDITLTLEAKALDAAHARADHEVKEAEAVAKENARTIILPLYQAKVAATLEHLEVAMAANEEVKAFEALVSQSGLSLHHGSFGSPYVIRNLSFPEGLKEFSKSVERLGNKKTL